MFEISKIYNSVLVIKKLLPTLHPQSAGHTLFRDVNWEKFSAPVPIDGFVSYMKGNSRFWRFVKVVNHPGIVKEQICNIILVMWTYCFWWLKYSISSHPRCFVVPGDLLAVSWAMREMNCHVRRGGLRHNLSKAVMKKILKISHYVTKSSPSRITEPEEDHPG